MYTFYLVSYIKIVFKKTIVVYDPCYFGKTKYEFFSCKSPLFNMQQTCKSAYDSLNNKKWIQNCNSDNDLLILFLMHRKKIHRRIY